MAQCHLKPEDENFPLKSKIIYAVIQWGCCGLRCGLRCYVRRKHLCQHVVGVGLFQVLDS